MEKPTPLYPQPEFAEAAPLLRRPDEAAEVIADYATVGTTLRRHPLSLLREQLNRRGFHTAEALWQMRNGAIARGAGLVVCRQRPMAAGGTTFVTIEDETGQIDLIVWPTTASAQRRPLQRAQLLAVTGTVQHEEGVLHLVAGRLQDLDIGFRVSWPRRGIFADAIVPARSCPFHRETADLPAGRQVSTGRERIPTISRLLRRPPIGNGTFDHGILLRSPSDRLA